MRTLNTLPYIILNVQVEQYPWSIKKIVYIRKYSGATVRKKNFKCVYML